MTRIRSKSANEMALLSGSLGVSIGDTCVVSSKKSKNYGIGMCTENK